MSHPSFPAGHAVAAGACVTVLKAFFRTHDSNLQPLKWPLPPIHSISGESLESYGETDTKDMTICGELNKLASNVSLGRNFAGVHYRDDSDGGMRLGEQIGVLYLQTKLREYSSNRSGTIPHFNLQRFDGSHTTITACGS